MRRQASAAAATTFAAPREFKNSTVPSYSNDLTYTALVDQPLTALRSTAANLTAKGNFTSPTKQHEIQK